MNTVDVQNRGIISISEIKIGDYVKTISGGDDIDNEYYTQVYGFGHFDDNREIPFIQLIYNGPHEEEEENNHHRHNNTQALEVSSKQLIFVSRDSNYGQYYYPIRASDIEVGDILSNGNIVTSINTLSRRGLYAPLTMSGDIIVSGIRSSNYIDILDHNGLYDQHIVGHAVFGPQRIYCTYFMNQCKQQTYNSNGYGSWANIIINIAFKLNSIGYVTNMIFSLFSIFVVHFMSLVELLLYTMVIGSSSYIGLGMVFVVVTIYVVMMKRM